MPTASVNGTRRLKGKRPKAVSVELTSAVPSYARVYSNELTIVYGKKRERVPAVRQVLPIEDERTIACGLEAKRCYIEGYIALISFDVLAKMAKSKRVPMRMGEREFEISDPSPWLELVKNTKKKKKRGGKKK